MIIAISIIFIPGYAAIALEHPIKKISPLALIGYFAVAAVFILQHYLTGL